MTVSARRDVIPKYLQQQFLLLYIKLSGFQSLGTQDQFDLGGKVNGDLVSNNDTVNLSVVSDPIPLGLTNIHTFPSYRCSG